MGSLDRFKHLAGLATVCARFQLLLRPMLLDAARRATDELALRRSEDGALLNLSGRGLGSVGCALVAQALSKGDMPGVRAVWLQDNAIETPGLLALANGLRTMPTGSSLRSVSLGCNAFHTYLAREPPKNLRRALRQLESAGRDRHVCIRLNS